MKTWIEPPLQHQCLPPLAAGGLLPPTGSVWRCPHCGRRWKVGTALSGPYLGARGWERCTRWAYRRAARRGTS